MPSAEEIVAQVADDDWGLVPDEIAAGVENMARAMDNDWDDVRDD